MPAKVPEGLTNELQVMDQNPNAMLAASTKSQYTDYAKEVAAHTSNIVEPHMRRA